MLVCLQMYHGNFAPGGTGPGFPANYQGANIPPHTGAVRQQKYHQGLSSIYSPLLLNIYAHIPLCVTLEPHPSHCHGRYLLTGSVPPFNCLINLSIYSLSLFYFVQ